MTWGLPPEFEVCSLRPGLSKIISHQSVCRDIWALHLSLLPNPPPAEPYYHTHGDGAPKKVAEGDSRSSSSEDSAEDEDPELADLLRQNSDLSSTSEEEAVVETVPVIRTRKKRSEHRYETPSCTIAVLVVALWTLRAPVLYRDLIR